VALACLLTGFAPAPVEAQDLEPPRDSSNILLAWSMMLSPWCTLVSARR